MNTVSVHFIDRTAICNCFSIGKSIKPLIIYSPKLARKKFGLFKFDIVEYSVFDEV